MSPVNFKTKIAALAVQVADGFDMDRAIPKPMRREPVEATPRKAMTAKRRARILAAQGSRRSPATINMRLKTLAARDEREAERPRAALQEAGRG